jgi:hypothetical protein
MDTGILMIVVGWCSLAQLAQAPAVQDSGAESVDVRYARAQLQLAEANLRRVEESNKRVERSVPANVVAEYRNDVAVAQARLEQATAGRAGGEFRVWLGRAAAERKAARTRWKSAVAANDRVPGTFGALDVERFRLRAEVAALELERGRTLVDAGREAQLEWEVDLLDNQVQRLKEESNRAAPSVWVYPGWGW